MASAPAALLQNSANSSTRLPGATPDAPYRIGRPRAPSPVARVTVRNRSCCMLSGFLFKWTACGTDRAFALNFSRCPLTLPGLGIPTKPDADSDLKPDSVPRRSRTPFRHEAGHFRRRPCGSWRMISDPQFAMQGAHELESGPAGDRMRLQGTLWFMCEAHSMAGMAEQAASERAPHSAVARERLAVHRARRCDHGTAAPPGVELASSTVSLMRSRRVSPLSSIR